MFAIYCMFIEKDVATVMQKMKKLNVHTVGSCSGLNTGIQNSLTWSNTFHIMLMNFFFFFLRFISGALNQTGDFCMTVSPEGNAAQTSPPDHSVPNKSMDSYLLCNKVRVYTSILYTVLPEGFVGLPLGTNGPLKLGIKFSNSVCFRSLDLTVFHTSYKLDMLAMTISEYRVLYHILPSKSWGYL